MKKYSRHSRGGGNPGFFALKDLKDNGFPITTSGMTAKDIRTYVKKRWKHYTSSSAISKARSFV